MPFRRGMSPTRWRTSRSRSSTGRRMSRLAFHAERCRASHEAHFRFRLDAGVSVEAHETAAPDERQSSATPPILHLLSGGASVFARDVRQFRPDR